MNVLWKAARPLSRNDIITMSVDKSWKSSSIHILLNGLLKKGAIKEAGFVKCGKTYGRLYEASIPCEEYYVENVFVRSGKAVLPMLFSALINSEELTPELVDELDAMLQKRKKELE